MLMTPTPAPEATVNAVPVLTTSAKTVITTNDDGEMISSRFKSFSDLTAETATSSVCSSISTLRPDTESPYTSVSFGVVEVREYERVPGDHPDVLVGLPITIGWAYKVKPSCPLDRYELKSQYERKNKRRASSSSQSQDDGCESNNDSPRLERLGSIARRKILEEFCTLEEIRMAEKSYAKYRKQREMELLQKALEKEKKNNAEGEEDKDEEENYDYEYTDSSKSSKHFSLKKLSSKIKNVFRRHRHR